MNVWEVWVVALQRIFCMRASSIIVQRTMRHPTVNFNVQNLNFLNPIFLYTRTDHPRHHFFNLLFLYRVYRLQLYYFFMFHQLYWSVSSACGFSISVALFITAAVFFAFS